MNSTNSKTVPSPRRGDLDSRYGEIGISAVAAALKYKSETKPVAKAPPATGRNGRWLEDIAA